MSQPHWILCEKPEDLQGRSGFVVYWASFQQGENTVSIPARLEQEGDALKSEYLQWLHDLSQSQWRGDSIVDYLAVRSDFSLWWMSLLVEKSPWKSPHLYNCFRLMAFERLLREKSPASVEVAVQDSDVAEAVAACCSNAGIPCNVEAFSASRAAAGVESLPHPLQALLVLGRDLLQRWPQKRDDLALEEGSETAIVSYFFNVDMVAAKEGKFRARYWTALHTLLEERKLPLRWLHLFVKSAAVEKPKQALQWLSVFNRSADALQRHALLDGPLRWSTVFRVVGDYLKLWKRSRSLRSAASLFRIQGSAVDLWPLMREEWRSSIYGKTAMANLVFLAQFERVLGAIARKKRGFYLLEGQGWERALIYAWHKAGHGELLGVPHTVISPWDLRHFFSHDDLQGDTLLLLPDSVVLNGEAAMRAYRDHGFPLSRMVGGEALRYLYLEKQQMKTNHEPQQEHLVLLVLGDYLPRITRRQMALLEQAAPGFPSGLELWVKGHPACPIDPQQWPSLKIFIISDPLDKIVGRYQIVFTSNPTAAAVDVYLSGGKVVTMLDPDQFNMSPLRGYAGVDFVATPQELAQAVCRFCEHPKVDNEEAEGFFFTDQELPRWQRLLDLSCPLGKVESG